ncbi:MAG: dimethylmenaquinone methyltransferase [Rhodospirillales bacterium 69-11]|nr:RraA family protein [Rhodospirillales bacterium]OJW31324.1 MAG: dimethylmenaquinone methyltransferase [Rhodospirillales bacterium 69-11]
MPPLPTPAELARLLYTPVLSDVLDGFGLMHQALRPFVRPLDDTLVLFGRARTGQYARATLSSADHNPYELEMDLIDGLQPGEVAVLACDGPTDWVAPWGELLSTAARARGAAGCVMDGLVRDVARIRSMKFPVFHGGIGPLDTRNRAEMVEKDVAVTVAGTRIAPGDWILGDVDGVVVVPEARAEEVFRAALEKIQAEDTTRAELEAGDSLRAVFARHGVL